MTTFMHIHQTDEDPRENARVAIKKWQQEALVDAARGILAQNDTPEYDPHRVIYVGDHEPGAIDRDLLAMFDKAWLCAAAACCVLVGFALGWALS